MTNHQDFFFELFLPKTKTETKLTTVPPAIISPTTSCPTEAK
ncbi:hypothetical protein V3A08_07285 [Tenacibaculum maritimum]